MGYSVQEAAERTGFSADTLRYYERIQLITDVPRDSGGRRSYDDDHLAWLDMLRCLRETGMPIQDMTRYAQLGRTDDTVATRLSLLREHATHVDERIATLTRQRHHLAEKIAFYESEETR